MYAIMVALSMLDHLEKSLLNYDDYPIGIALPLTMLFTEVFCAGRHFTRRAGKNELRLECLECALAYRGF